MPRHSAGLLLFRKRDGKIEVFLVHPGGPYWAGKDHGAWSIPKGEFIPGEEEPLATAMREFKEETGFDPPNGELIPLTQIRQPGGKIVHSWAVEGDCDASAVRSNTCAMEWPPRSGRYRRFAEVDRAQWFSLEEARIKILRGQVSLLQDLEELVEETSARSGDGVSRNG